MSQNWYMWKEAVSWTCTVNWRRSIKRCQRLRLKSLIWKPFWICLSRRKRLWAISTGSITLFSMFCGTAAGMWKAKFVPVFAMKWRRRPCSASLFWCTIRLSEWRRFIGRWRGMTCNSGIWRRFAGWFACWRSPRPNTRVRKFARRWHRSLSISPKSCCTMMPIRLTSWLIIGKLFVI